MKTPQNSNLDNFSSKKQRISIINQHQNNNNLNQFTQKDKITYLHKMLDHQIQTVSTLFDKNNAFQQIQIKLKQLQVKLNTIKQQDNKIQFNSISQNSRNSLSNVNAYFKQGYKENNTLSMPFQSLGEYKSKKKDRNSSKNSKITKKKSKINQSQQCEVSSKRLKFDEIENEQNNTQNIYVTIQPKKKQYQLSNRKIIQQNVKDESMKKWLSTKRRSKSSNENLIKNRNQKSYEKQLSMTKNSKKKRLSSKKLNKQFDYSHKSTAQNSSKKLIHSKTTTQFNDKCSWKHVPAIYGNQSLKIKKTTKHCQELNNHKNKVKEIILQNQNRKLERQLSNYKLRNQNLRDRVRQLRNYKNQYDKLKNIFEKDENYRKNKAKY